MGESNSLANEFKSTGNADWDAIERDAQETYEVWRNVSDE